MNAKAIIIWLIVGAVAGWLAGMVVKGGGYGLIGNIIVGIVGGLIAGWLYRISALLSLAALLARLSTLSSAQLSCWSF